MATNQEPTWPKGVSQPAQRALASAGIASIDDLTGITEADLRKLHGMGPKAFGLLREALAAKGLSFKPETGG